MTSERVNILGVGISAIDMALALKMVNAWIEAGDRQYVCVTGVHGVMESQRDVEVRRIHNRAGMVTPDGMPLVWLSRLSGRRHVDRVYGPDLMLALCERGLAKGYRHYFYGGAEGVPEKAVETLRKKYPGLQIAGTYSPPFRPLTEDERAAVVARINAAEADIVWVGLSTPKQERWMAAQVGALDVNVLIGVGAAFDFIAGTKRQAPRWIQRSGFEWLYRLVQEPRRLWKRYLINNPAFIFLVAAQALGIKRYFID
jgi:N-acetylglucosaminyldiphosphoundecaprenol N-acetyl-beta-D-mannosaminyltransferase